MVIEVRELAKSYENVHALKGLSIDIAAGGIVGLLGPNGAGKTTFVEILEGLRPATSGSVRVLGLDPQKSPSELRRRLGVQLQQTEFPEALTVEETFGLFGSFYPRTLDASQVLAAVDSQKASWTESRPGFKIRACRRSSTTRPITIRRSFNFSSRKATASPMRNRTWCR